MEGLSREDIAYALQVASARGYRRVKLGEGEEVFSASIGGAVSSLDAPLSVPTEVGDSQPVLKATAVGFFRPARSGLEPGQQVSVGDVVGEIVALGIANDVVAVTAGTVAEVLVEQGEAVEYGQALARLES